MAAAVEKKKRCLYEILNVPRDSTPDEIRSAYRKLALQLHPDKVAAQSGGTVTPEATGAFQELLHAYEILSDPKERAYYDSHRTQILFSDPNSTSSKKSSFMDLDLFSFFSSSAFSGYSDTGRGFYKVYGDVFSKIYEKELWYLKELGLLMDSVSPPPLIGNSESDYSQVTAFYAYWAGFCTVMDFGWADMYDVAAGNNRKARRVMEEENKKLRKKAKKDYNESVRELAAFVKKRDKRVIDKAKERSMQEEKRRVEEREKKKELERNKMERARMYKEPDWAKVEEEVDDEDDNGLLEEHESMPKNKKNGNGGDNELYCVICSKKFKSEKQWKNHEQSKKHRDKVAELRESMLHDGVDGDSVDDSDDDEPTLIDDFKEDLHVKCDYVPGSENNNSVMDKMCDEFENGVGLNVEKDEAVTSQETGEEPELDDEVDVLEAMAYGHRSRKTVNLEQSNTSSSKAFLVDSDEDSFTEYANRKKGRKNRTNRKGNRGKADEECLRKNREVELHQQEDNAENGQKSSSQFVPDVETRSTEDLVLGKNQKPKSQQVDGKGTSKKDKDLVSKNPTKGNKYKGAPPSKAPSNACDTCGESFESRTRLFKHLGEMGHATLKLR